MTRRPARATRGRAAAAALAVALLAAVGTATLAAQAAPAGHVARGDSARRALDPRGALAHYDSALAGDSLDYGANWRAAVAVLDLAEAMPDTAPRARRDSLYARAARHARRAAAAKPEGADGHFALAAALGRVALTIGRDRRVRYAGAIRAEALRALELDPRHDGAWHVLGRWHAEVMRLSGVSRFVARNFLGADVFKQASWDQAIASLERAVAIDPGRIYHRLELARIYADRKRYGDARRELARVAALPVREVGDPRYKREAAALLRDLEDRR